MERGTKEAVVEREQVKGTLKAKGLVGDRQQSIGVLRHRPGLVTNPYPNPNPNPNPNPSTNRQ